MHRPISRAIMLLLAAVVSALLAGSGAALAQGDQPVEAKTFPCQVFASDRVELASPVEGVIESVPVDRGMLVHKGDVVATLRSEIERVQLALAQARAASTAQLRSKNERYALETRKLERNLDLVRKNLVSASDIDQMRSDKEVASLEVVAAEEAMQIARLEADKAAAQLDIRSIRTPVDGIVVERRLSVGELVRDKPVVVIAKIDPLYAEVALPVAYMGNVKEGIPGKIVFNAPGVAAQTLPAALVDRVIEPTSNTFGVRFVLKNSAGQVPAGTKCRVTFWDQQNLDVVAKPQR